MELINRYLHAVKFWLPKAQQDDIIAELSEDIRSQIEDRETELGRKLSEAEVAALLKQLGRPVFVANRYLPQQHLIGPVLFPIYLFVLKRVMLFYLAPSMLIWISLMVFSPLYRALHSGGSFMGAMESLWGAFWLTAFISIGVVTLVFAIFERTQAKSRFMEEWDPRKLPAVCDPRRIPRSSSIAELVTWILLIIWWMSAVGFRTVFEFPGARITLAPEWRYFVGGFLFEALIIIAVSGVNLFRPRWTPLRAGFRLAADLIGSALWCWLLNSAILVEIIVPNVPAAKTQEITNAINLWMARAVPVAVIVGVILLLVNVRRIFRARTIVIKTTPWVAA